MRRRALLATLAAAAAALAGASPAAGQGVAVRTIGPEAAPAGVIPVHPTGSLVVEWASDPETCAALGRCGLSGMTTWRMPASGDLYLFGPRGGTRAFLSLGRVFEGGGSEAYARVRRGSHLCADTTAVYDFSALESRQGRLALSFGDQAVASALTSRCAGPVLEDVDGVVPRVYLPASRLRRGNMRVRLAGEGVFAAHGFRGTVRSTLSLRLGAPNRPEQAPDVGPDPGTPRTRFVSSRFRVAEVRGEIALDVTGAAPDEGCAALDSCGLAGTIRLVPRLSAGSAELLARVPARLGRRAALAAVGRAPGPVPRGTVTFGSAYWAGAGLLAASIGRPEDPVACRDSLAAPYAALFLQAEGDEVEVTLLPPVGAPLRTRCPGPVLGPFPETPLARARVPLRAFGARRVELTLSEPATAQDDGWRIASRPSLTVVLEHRAVEMRLLRGWF